MNDQTITPLDASQWGRTVDLFDYPNIGAKIGLAGSGGQRLDPNIPHDWTVYVHRPDITQQGAIDLTVEWGSGGTFQEETYPSLFAIRSVFHIVSALPPRVSVKRATASGGGLQKGQDIVRVTVAPGRPARQTVSGCQATTIVAGTSVTDWALEWELPFGTQELALVGTYIGIPLSRTPIAISHGPVITTTGNPFLVLAQGVENLTARYAVTQGAGASLGTGAALKWRAQPFVLPSSVGGFVVYWQATVLR